MVASVELDPQIQAVVPIGPGGAAAILGDSDFARDTRQDVTLLDYLRDYVGRLRGGDMGPLPAIAGLVVLYIVFGLANDKFWSLLNQANLVVQAGAICVLAMGLVLVLLGLRAGEIRRARCCSSSTRVARTPPTSTGTTARRSSWTRC